MPAKWEEIILWRRSIREVRSFIAMLFISVVVGTSCFGIASLYFDPGAGTPLSDAELVLRAGAYIGSSVLGTCALSFILWRFVYLPINFRFFKKRHGPINFVYRSEAMEIYYTLESSFMWLYNTGVACMFLGGVALFVSIIVYFPVTIVILGMPIRLITSLILLFMVSMLGFATLLARFEIRAMDWLDENRHLFPEIRRDPPEPARFTSR